jgi:hypothetical protein
MFMPATLPASSSPNYRRVIALTGFGGKLPG